MGREVRRVPKDWEHPKRNGRYIPLNYYGKPFSQVVKEWDEESAKWDQGFKDDYHGGWKKFDKSECDMTFAEWHGERMKKEDYMPEFPEKKMTHYQMYETCSEGTPISPVMETPEELARWLADNNASAFGAQSATYDEWLNTIKEGSCPSFYITKDYGIISGVSATLAMKQMPSQEKDVQQNEDGGKD